MASIFHAVGQIPFTSVAVVFSILVGVIFIVSDDRRKDLLRFFKGVILTVVLSFVTLSSVIVLKYFSYLKIDVMQLGVYGTLFFAATFAYVIFSRSLAGSKSLLPVALPYPVKQVLVFLIALAYLLWVDTGLSMYWTVVAIMPINVVYHLYYIKILDKVFSWIMKLNERFEEKVMVSE